jgi:hypothetical protein
MKKSGLLVLLLAIIHSASAEQSRTADEQAARNATEFAGELLFLTNPGAAVAAEQDRGACGLFTPRTSGKVLDRCCICFADTRTGKDEAKIFNNTCKDWLRNDSDLCPKDSRYLIPMTSETPYQEGFDGLPLACSHVRIMGAFHGVTSDYWMPFHLAQTLARQLRARDVCYDGVSCLVFNNLEKLDQCARNARSPECDFTISGNQNAYLMRQDNAGLRGKTLLDLPSSSSKTTVRIRRDGDISIRYDQCSFPGTRCAWVNPNTLREVSNDPNAKMCVFNGGPVLQACCRNHPSEKRFDDDGQWSAPGRPCP